MVRMMQDKKEACESEVGEGASAWRNQCEGMNECDWLSKRVEIKG